MRGEMANPKVFLDMTTGGAPCGSIAMVLSADVARKASENLHAPCAGE